jgi:4-hydroxythreonine-4-phosphate dehydrogenase
MGEVSRIALTPGEPAGIGPDLCLFLAQQGHSVELVIVTDPAILVERAASREIVLHLRTFDERASPRKSEAGELTVLPVVTAVSTRAGSPDPRNAGHILETLDIAVRGCMENRFAALVTGPVHKGTINDAGIPFTGHTEYLRDRTGAQQAVMMLVTEGLRVALATTHIPLAAVSLSLDRHQIEQTLRILDISLRRYFGISKPHLLVSGLNPHAGEGGYLGHEEIDIIAPALETVRAEGLRISGPLPADTLFTPKYLAQADAVLAMYHDQGLPVLKYIGFGSAVNITLGLPIIRTSVDHGTALELAGRGEINTGSIRAALDCAVNMATHARRDA